MIRPGLLLILMIFLLNNLSAQKKVEVNQQEVSSGIFMDSAYSELPNPVTTDADWWKGRKGIRVSWGSTDIRYKKEMPVPEAKDLTKIKLYAWKGERVSAQWVVSNFDSSVTLSYKVSDLIKRKNKEQKIHASLLYTGFVRYVMTDELNKDRKGACGYRKRTDYDSSLVADVIDNQITSLKISAQSTRSGWVAFEVPVNAALGQYKGNVTLFGNGQIIGKLEVELEVSDHVLPEPSADHFHLDLWQNPYAVARYYNVEPWSKAHFEHLRRSMKPYADAGGDVITASITHKPWNGQTYDYFETMVTWMKKADGSWYFDYTIFDKWVEFMMSLGVDKQINCYSMIPWRLSFQYYDQATNQLRYLEAKPGEKAYEDFWGAMLTSFARHLKKKGWFEKTYIAMDERPMEAMQKTLAVIHQADKNFKVALAGNWYAALSPDIDDYCIPYGENFPMEILTKRQADGKFSTFYTSCAQPYPNSFTFSSPAESEWLGWYAAAGNLDGFLRWAYNSWVKNPLQDSRFRTWAAGDTYLVYPGGRPSIRFERLTEGIRQYEKIRLLQKSLSDKKDYKGLQKLNTMLENFKQLNPEKESAASGIQKGRKVLREF